MSQQSLDDLSLDEISDIELEEKMSNVENKTVTGVDYEDSQDNVSDADVSDNEILKGGGDESEGYDNDEEDEEDNDYGVSEQKENEPDKIKTKQFQEIDTEEFEDEESEQDENYLMKFDKEIRKNYLIDFHPETLTNNHTEIQALVNIVRDNRNMIVDKFHKTLSFLTKYEKTRILGQRAKQINSGSKPYINVENEFGSTKVLDGYLIAMKELELKRIPFIIRRPLPNGGSEYWRLQDLELIC